MWYLYACGHSKHAAPWRSNITKELDHKCSACDPKPIRNSVLSVRTEKKSVSSFFRGNTAHVVKR